MLNLTTTASASSRPELQTDTCQPRQFSAISEHSSVKGTPQAIRDWLMLSQPDSHASPFPSPESKPEPTTSEICGQPRGTLFASYDRADACLKMSQGCLPLDIAQPSSETWPRSGTMRNGACFQLPEREARTCGNGSSLLPTIGRNEFRGTSKNRYRGSLEFRGAKMAEGLRTGPNDPAYLNPLFAEWAMGFPISWTDLQPLEMRKVQQWLLAHGKS